MKLYLLKWTLVFTLIASCSSEGNKSSNEEPVSEQEQAVQDTFKTYPGLESIEGLYYKKGEREPFTGSTESKYDNGLPFVRADFRKGKLHGTYTAYYYNGQKMGVSNYSEGVKHGESIAWHENGEKASEITFKNGQEEGILKVYYPNGQQRLEAKFKEGVRVGITILWDSTGTMLNNNSLTH